MKLVGLDISDLRLFLLILLSFTLMACGAPSWKRPVPLDQVDFLTHARSITNGDITVRVSIPSKQETKEIFGTSLYADQIQPVWVEVDNRSSKLATYNAKLNAQNPTMRLKQGQQSVLLIDARLQRATANLLTNKRAQLSNAARTLNAISPLQTLERGYSITLNSEGAPIVDIDQVKANDAIETRLHNGSIISHVESCIKNDS